VNALREAGIKLRDATSFGLPGHVRLGVLPPDAQDALQVALAIASAASQ
jgi:histidinol-phosphate aminotransferase